MMKKFYLLFIAIFMAGSAGAQCSGGRYMNEIFPVVTIDSVKYSTVYNQFLDVYQPSGDTLSARPLLILAHGGSFVTENGGRKDDKTVDSLCAIYARRGYVTASIDYRTVTTLTLFDSAAMVDEVVKAISDGKAAIRFFMKDRLTTNTYKIDTNNIFIGGNSAGAVLYMHVGYLDSIAEVPANIAAAMAANGGFDGNSGNSGYTLKSKAILNLAGALNQTSFVSTGNKPSFNVQGTTDNVVPYMCGYPVGGIVHINLCGLGALEPVYTSKGIYHMSHIFPGDGHVPWNGSLSKFVTVDSMMKIFLYNMVCPGVSEVEAVGINSEINIYPNPASEAVNFSSSSEMAEISVYDLMGRVLYSVENLNRRSYEVNTSGLSTGIYTVKIRLSDAANTPVIKQIVIR